MRRLLLPLLLSPFVFCDEIPRAKMMGLSDVDMLKKTQLPQGTKIRVHNGVVHDEVDDYQEFDKAEVKNGGGANHELTAVTFKPNRQNYDIPSLDDESGPAGKSMGLQVSTLSPVAQKAPSASSMGKQAQPIVRQQLPVYQPRTGYFFQHYPWDRLPRQYLLRPGFQYILPPQYQATSYSYPHQLPYTDPYNIYRNNPAIRVPCGGYGGYGQSGCGGGCGQSSGCGGGCGGSSGCGGGQDDDEGYDRSGSTEDSEEDSETESGRSGEAHINKKDPLDDLDLEDLEKLDKAKGSSERLHKKQRRQ